MSEDSDLAALIVAYMAARQRFVGASARADDLHKRLTAAATAVQDTHLATKERGHRSFSAHNENTAIKAVPTAAEILEVMTDWAAARSEGRAAWGAIPKDGQAALARPPNGLIAV